jgi:hypothetical protein
LVVFLKRIAYLFLVIHELLLLVFEEDAFVDSEDKGRGKVLAVVVEFWEGVFGRERVPLEFGAELNFDVIFGRTGF